MEKLKTKIINTLKKIRNACKSVKAKLFFTLCITVLCVIVFLIFLNSFALEKFYLYSKQQTLKGVYNKDEVGDVDILDSFEAICDCGKMLKLGGNHNEVNSQRK